MSDTKKPLIGGKDDSIYRRYWKNAPAQPKEN